MRTLPRLRGGRRLPGGLAFRIGLMVFLCALATSGVVTWVSVRSLQDFVRDRIDRELPELAQVARARTRLWYERRELEVAELARSESLRAHAAGLAPGAPPAEARRARENLAGALRSVPQRSPQLAGLVVLDGAGRPLLRAGALPALAAALRSELAGLEGRRIGRPRALEGGRVQLVSSPLPGAEPGTGGAPGASLHAALRLEALAAHLAGAELPPGAELRVVDGKGRLLLGPAWRGGPAADALAAVPRGAVATLRDGAGVRHVATASALDRFGARVVLTQPYATAFAPVATAVRRALAIDLLAAGLLSLAAFAVAAWRLRPLDELARGARRLAAGEAEVAVPMPRGDDEVRTLARAFNDMASRLEAGRMELESRNAELQRANEVLEQLSITDGLTKLHNHRHFQDQLAHEARRAARTAQPLCLVLIDVDDFKPLNDRLGHSAGDRVLERVAAVMAGALRETDYLARYGGEEFALLAPDTALTGAVALGEKIRTAVADCPLPFEPGEGPRHVTVSVGVAAYAESARATFDAADRALYEAKEAGKDCVVAARG